VRHWFITIKPRWDNLSIVLTNKSPGLSRNRKMQNDGRIYHQQTEAIARERILSNLLLGVDNHANERFKGNLYLAMTKILAESSVILLR